MKRLSRMMLLGSIAILISSCNLKVDYNNPISGDNTQAQKVAIPVLNPAGPLVTTGTAISISSETPDSEIYYVIGDVQSEPDQITGTLYDPAKKPIIGENSSIKVVAFREGFAPSDPVSINYVVTDSPTIIAVSPSKALSDKPTSVIITGTGFLDVQTVSFGSNAADSFTIDSDLQITAILPAGLADGSYDVTLIAPKGSCSWQAIEVSSK
ncbi:MAG: IPT/TIG domain-containing protein [bacterium]